VRIEMYCKQFHKERVYPESKEYLLKATSNNLKPINYEHNAELYWKKKLEANLPQEEEKRT